MACVPNWQLNGRWPHNYKLGPFERPRCTSYRLWLLDPAMKPRQQGFTGWPFPRSPDSWCKKKVTGLNRCTGVHRQPCLGQGAAALVFQKPPYSFPLFWTLMSMLRIRFQRWATLQKTDFSWQVKLPQLSQLQHQSNTSVHGASVGVSMQEQGFGVTDFITNSKIDSCKY